MDRLAEQLVENDEAVHDALVAARRRRGLTVEQVVERMLNTPEFVEQFERYDANPTVSEVRRYAMAVGVRLETRVLLAAEIPEGMPGLSGLLG